MNRMKLFIGSILCCALSSVANASIYSLKIRPIHFNLKPSDYSRGLDLSLIQPVESTRGLKTADVQKVIPTDLDPNDQNGVGRRILNNTVSSALNSDAVRSSSLGQTAQSVQNSMQGGIAVGSREPNSVHHEITAALDPMQAMARINYSGLANAQLSYHASESKTNFEMREPVSAIATDVVYNHTDIPGDRRDVMSLRWVW